MPDPVRDFARVYLVTATVLLVVSAGTAFVAHLAFLYVTTLVFVLGGLAYVLASALAWTGFGNLYRWSPTLLLGSRSYRQRVIRGELWKEGRDEGALMIGLAFGAALMAVGAALWDPLFILVDGLGLVLVAVFLRSRRVRATLRS